MNYCFKCFDKRIIHTTSGVVWCTACNNNQLSPHKTQSTSQGLVEELSKTKPIITSLEGE